MKLAMLLPETDPTAQAEDFERFFESHLTYILDRYIVDQREIVSNIGRNFKGDFYGLLRDQGFEFDLHYMLMRLNGFTSSADYQGDTFMLKLPDFQEVKLLKRAFETNRVI